jgi:hypothetical protein
MQRIDFYAEHNRLGDIIQEMDDRLNGQYDPALDDFQREAAELRWQLWPA